MVKSRNFLIASMVFSTVGFLSSANARESFYDLNSGEPSVSVNLGALDRLEQPVYAPPPAPVSKTYRTKSKSHPRAIVQPALSQPSLKQMPIVSDSMEPAPIPPPARPTKSTSPHNAPPLPKADDNLSAAMHDVPAPPPPPVVLPSIKGHEDNALPPPPPPLPKAPVKTVEPPPLPPALPSIKNNNSLPDLPPPPPLLPKANVQPPPNISATPSTSNNAPLPRITVSSKAPPVMELPKAAETKATDNIVALPPAPPPPPLKSIADKSKDLPPPKPPNSDALSLPPPLPPSMPDDVDKKIAEQKAKIDAQVAKASTAVKNAVSTPPVKNVTPDASLPELPPLPPAPPPLDNSLPPLPIAQTNNNTSTPSSKASDLPPLDTVLNKNQASPSPPVDLKDSMPAKETVMMAPDKIPVASSGANGPITMSYSEAETEVPLVEKSKLDDVISQLEADKSKTVTLIAYASGTPEQASQAKRTSLARVLSVRKYMMERNIDPDRINPRPLGNHAEGGVPDRVDIIVEKGSKV